MEAYELSQLQGDNKKKIENPAVTDEKPKLKNLFAELKANGQIWLLVTDMKISFE